MGSNRETALRVVGAWLVTFLGLVTTPNNWRRSRRRRRGRKESD